MTFKVNDVNINYVLYGNADGDTLIFLHGWGQNIEMMKCLADNFKNDYDVLIVDLPGFGLSSEPTYSWSVYDYADALNELVKHLKLKNISLIGHSFGGKVSLVYASKYKVDKLVVLASPFKKDVEELSLKIKTLKFMMKIPGLKQIGNVMKKYVGSTDYRNASDMMRKVLVNTVNTDICKDVKLINCPTLIIWGSNDSAVSIEEAYELEKLIKDSAVIKFEGASHYAYLEHLYDCVKILKSFFGGNK